MLCKKNGTAPTGGKGTHAKTSKANLEPVAAAKSSKRIRKKRQKRIYWKAAQQLGRKRSFLDEILADLSIEDTWRLRNFEKLEERIQAFDFLSKSVVPVNLCKYWYWPATTASTFGPRGNCHQQNGCARLCRSFASARVGDGIFATKNLQSHPFGFAPILIAVKSLTLACSFGWIDFTRWWLVKQ